MYNSFISSICLNFQKNNRLRGHTKNTDVEEASTNQTLVSFSAPERWIHENKAMRALVRNTEGVAPDFI